MECSTKLLYRKALFVHNTAISTIGKVVSIDEISQLFSLKSSPLKSTKHEHCTSSIITLLHLFDLNSNLPHYIQTWILWWRKIVSKNYGKRKMFSLYYFLFNYVHLVQSKQKTHGFHFQIDINFSFGFSFSCIISQCVIYP